MQAYNEAMTVPRNDEAFKLIAAEFAITSNVTDDEGYGEMTCIINTSAFHLSKKHANINLNLTDWSSWRYLF